MMPGIPLVNYYGMSNLSIYSSLGACRYDWPASPAAGVTLQNDLDLEVTPAQEAGVKLRGNGWQDNINTVSPMPVCFHCSRTSAPDA